MSDSLFEPLAWIDVPREDRAVAVPVIVDPVVAPEARLDQPVVARKPSVVISADAPRGLR